LSDAEIDRLIEGALNSFEDEGGPEAAGPAPAPRGVHLPLPRPPKGPGVWYVLVFLLGMTFMEGLTVLAPAPSETRGPEGIYRCGQPRASPNPQPVLDVG
jgi:hypothetical protein